MPILPDGPFSKFFAEEVQAPILLTEDLFEKIARNINALISSAIERIDFVKREALSAPQDLNNPIFGYYPVIGASVIDYIFFYGRFSTTTANCSINLLTCQFNNLAAEQGLMSSQAICSSTTTGHFAGLFAISATGSVTTIYSHNIIAPTFSAQPAIASNELVYPEVTSLSGSGSLSWVHVTIFTRKV